jgi:hypothetical protein
VCGVEVCKESAVSAILIADIAGNGNLKAKKIGLSYCTHPQVESWETLPIAFRRFKYEGNIRICEYLSNIHSHLANGPCTRLDCELCNSKPQRK